MGLRRTALPRLEYSTRTPSRSQCLFVPVLVVDKAAWSVWERTSGLTWTSTTVSISSLQEKFFYLLGITVADLYIVLFDKIRVDPKSTPHGREGYYFGASGEHLLYDVAKSIAEALVALGKGKSPEPTTFTQEDLDKYFGGVRRVVWYSTRTCSLMQHLHLYSPHSSAATLEQ